MIPFIWGSIMNGSAMDGMMPLWMPSSRRREKLFPHLYVHFEDFGRENAARLLERYEDRYAVYTMTSKAPGR